MAKDDQIKSQIRLPAELHGKLVAAAEQSGRSLNAEMVHRLEAIFPPEAVEAELLQRRIQEASMLRITLNRLRWELEKLVKKHESGDFSPYGRAWQEEVLGNNRAQIVRLESQSQRINDEIKSLSAELAARNPPSLDNAN